MKKYGQLIELVLMNLRTVMMCFSPHLAPIGGHLRKMVRTIPFMYFVIYLLMIKKSFLMKIILVVRMRFNCSREREIIITRKYDIQILLEVNKNVSTRKIKGRLMSLHPLRRIKRRRHVATMEGGACGENMLE